MAKKTTNSREPPAPPVLVVRRVDARRQVEDRVAKGVELQSAVIQNEEQLQQAKAEYLRWHSYNGELLTRIFSNRTETDNYNWWGIASVGGERSFSSMLRELHKDLDEKLARLRSLLDRLELIPE